jgi:acetylornithine deacetylase/succinyl-diaminopimelate desuccinylase-like protein
MKNITLLLIASFFFGYAIGQTTPEVKKKISSEVEQVAKKMEIAEAFTVIDQIDKQTIANLITLTEIPAPPFMEGERAVVFKNMLKEAGADSVWIDPVGNVIALKKGLTGERTIVLDAHLDTVFPEGTDVTVKHKGDTLYAPGIGDDTRGLSMVVAILHAMEATHIETDAHILFVGTVGEEGLGDLRGVKYLFNESGIKIDSWISIDGGKIGRVNNRALGSVRYKALFKGKGGHSWGAFGLGNPHHALGIAIDYFTQAAGVITNTEEKITSFNVGRIGGGTSVNSIPFESWMEVDMRSKDPGQLDKIEKTFKESMNRALNDYNATNITTPVTLELIPIGLRPSGETDPEQALVQRALAASSYFKAEPKLTIGSTNANIPIAKGIPGITIGRGGDGGHGHALNEWWLNNNGAEAIKLALLITVSEAGLSKKIKKK